VKVYHGSYIQIDSIDLNMCEPRKDFGRGFYVTNIRKQAEKWAERVSIEYQAKGVVTEFIFDETAFSDSMFQTLRFDNYTEEWLDFVTLNRNPASPVPAHGYDIVEGPVADDKIQRRIRAYMGGRVPKLKFLEELRYHEPTHQICFCTLESLQMLERVDFNPVINMEDIGEAILEALVTDREIDETVAYDLYYTSATYQDLADKTTGLYVKTWQEVYEMLKLELKDKTI
jgi:hypothetical protein